MATKADSKRKRAEALAGLLLAANADVDGRRSVENLVGFAIGAARREGLGKKEILALVRLSYRVLPTW